MIRKIKLYFYNKIADSRREHPIYILPTIDGFKVVLLNMVLLVMGLSYANNYILLLNFILFCLFLGSMFYTHFNLSGIKIVSAVIPQLHAGEEREFIVHFSSSSKQGHHFVLPNLRSNYITVKDPEMKYSLTEKNNHSIKFLVRGSKRGHEQLTKIYLETLFPFNFFRCFTFFTINQDLFVYPEIKAGATQSNNLLPDLINKDGDDFFIRDYQTGDSLKRVDWKKLAQTNKWFTRQFDISRPEPVILTCEESVSEEALSSLCFSIHKLHNMNACYGLKLGSQVFIPPGNSTHHLLKCLRELASYET